MEKSFYDVLAPGNFDPGFVLVSFEMCPTILIKDGMNQHTL
jgi:hypothetical protein